MLRQQLRCFCANGHAKIKNEFTGSDSVAGELPALAGRAPHWITGAKAIRRTRMPGFGLLHGIHRQSTTGVNAGPLKDCIRSVAAI